jgi:hypothetical protein
MHRGTVLIVSLFTLLAGLVAHASGDGRANDLLARARAALGGEKQLTKVLGLSAAGTYTRAVSDRQLSGELTIDLQLPDKMVRTESMNPMGDATIVTLQGINGDQLVRNSRTIGGGPNMIIRMGAPAAGSDAEAQALRNQRAELARLTLGFLLTAPASMPLEFTYGGEAAAEDGKADILDVKGPGTFAVRLFLDQTSHRPLMLSYKGVAPTIVMRTERNEGPPDPARMHARKEAAEAAPPAGQPQLVDISMFFDDYRQIDGVWLPSHVSRSIDGKPNVEWTFKTIKVNPTFKPDAFSGK